MKKKVELVKAVNINLYITINNEDSNSMIRVMQKQMQKIDKK